MTREEMLQHLQDDVDAWPQSVKDAGVKNAAGSAKFGIRMCKRERPAMANQCWKASWLPNANLNGSTKAKRENVQVVTARV